MALSRVELTPEVFSVCCTHALTTETEEIMGLLLGDIHRGPNGEAVARIAVAVPQIRTDRRKDRVEASPEQLASAMATAEKLSEGGGPKVRVIGWYHSHPHITVLPSHVDVRTQASYQMLDEGFVGIIVSAFNRGADGAAQVQVTAFQSVRKAAPGSATSGGGSAEALDSPMAKALAASKAEAPQWAVEGDEEQWQRREVALWVGAETGGRGRSLDGIHGLLATLLTEERQAFHGAVQAATDAHGRVDPLTVLHHTGLYQQHLCRLMDTVSSLLLLHACTWFRNQQVVGPTLSALRVRAAQLDIQARQLQRMKQSRLQDAARRKAGRPPPASHSTEQGRPVSHMDAPVPSAAATLAAREPHSLHVTGLRSGGDAPSDAAPAHAGHGPRMSTAAPVHAPASGAGSGPDGGRRSTPWAQANPAAGLHTEAGIAFSSPRLSGQPAATASSQADDGAVVERSCITHEVLQAWQRGAPGSGSPYQPELFQQQEQQQHPRQQQQQEEELQPALPSYRIPGDSYDAGMVNIEGSSLPTAAHRVPSAAKWAVANGSWPRAGEGSPMESDSVQAQPMKVSQGHWGVDTGAPPQRQDSGQLDLAALNSGEAGSTTAVEEGRSKSKPMKSLLRKINPLAKRKDAQPDAFAELTPEIASVASRRN